MTRRGDPERICAAHRAGVVARCADRIGSERAERLVAAWEVEAEARGIVRGDARFWSEGDQWLDQHHQK